MTDAQQRTGDRFPDNMPPAGHDSSRRERRRRSALPIRRRRGWNWQVASHRGTRRGTRRAFHQEGRLESSADHGDVGGDGRRTDQRHHDPVHMRVLEGPGYRRRQGERFVHGQSRMDWQDKDVLVIDEVSMLGARTLHAVNKQLCRLRRSQQDFGGISIVLFCGDFHLFRPVQERPILLPSAAVSWDEDNSFKAEQWHQHDKAHALWKRFTTVIMLDEQVRAAGDPVL
ncbi:hypothetical protein BKA56DRAFT_235803 [Ilyonectria sp. MPI-CAGE-AT-0026]|nr:hypothetical protein BKA56DRAFT_235803 [Ilyonectria sp. MPI-CAGE-AT-0026]